MDSLTKRPIMGIGMVMPHVVEIFPYGHMWVYWKEEKDFHCRGYYPVRGDIPSPVRNNRMKMLRFFAKKDVAGHYVDDAPAKVVLKECPEQIFKKEWDINQEQLELLRTRCHLPKEKYQIEGRYSWNKRRPDWDNCSSWTLKVVYHVMYHITRNKTFLECPSPKQLSVVKEFIGSEIKWTNVPKEGGNKNTSQE